MRRSSLAVVVLCACAAFVFASFVRQAGAQAPGGMPPGGPGGGRPPGMMGMAPDSFAAERDSLVAITMERIKGRENAPAESVWKNIQVMKGRTAQQVLRSMNGMGRSLGVSCRHCHIENHWAEEDKQAKHVARNMMRMTAALNDSLIPSYQWPRDDKPRVSCFTCHRGHANPMAGMPRPGGPGGPGAPGMPGRPEGGRPEGDRR